MKNANSRFVRVLAVALVVLMVLPAALVGCGSNKANDAAISEALAAAQAAKDAADKAQQKAEAAQKELEEANKKAEQLEAELEALKTTKAPEATTAPVAADKAQVVALAQETLKNLVKVLSDIEKGFDGKTAFASDLYTGADEDAIAVLYEKAVIAVYKAVTIDEIVEIEETFKADVDAVPTYAERVYEAYKAIDFESDVDVVDVVYAAALTLEASVETAKEIKAYGDEKLNLEELIISEFYRYTGLEAAKAIVDTTDIKPLYTEAYAGALDIAKKILDIVGEDLEVSALKYTQVNDVADINEDLEDWFEENFEGEDIEANYAAFRQAFVGAPVILTKNKTEDAVYAAVLALNERKDVVEAAYEAYDDFATELEGLAGNKLLKDIDLEDDAEDLAAVRAAFDAWVAEYGLVDEKGNLNEDVIKSIIVDYDAYLESAKVIDFLSAVKEAVAKVDFEALEDAEKQITDSDEDIKGRFDYAKYAASIKAVKEWFDKFGDIKPGVGDYEDYDIDKDKYAIKAFIDDADETVIDYIFKETFGESYEDFNKLYNQVIGVYEKLTNIESKLETNVNEVIKNLLKAGINADNIKTLTDIAGSGVSAYLDLDEDDKKDNAKVFGDSFIGKMLKDKEDSDYIKIEDVNFKSMIDWEGLEALWDSVDAMLVDANEAVLEIMNAFYAIKAKPQTDGSLKYDDYYLAKGTKAIALDVFAYELVKKLDEDAKKLDVAAELFETDAPTYTYYLYDSNKKPVPVTVSYNEAYAKAQNLISEFHITMMEVGTAAEAIVNALPVFDRATAANASDWVAGTALDKYVLGAKVAEKYAKALAKSADIEEDGRKAYDWVANDVAYELGKANLTKVSNPVLTVGSGSSAVSYGFNEAVMSVDPMSYFTFKYPDADGDGKISATEKEAVLTRANFTFDAKSYIDAVNKKLDEYYAKYQAEYLLRYSTFASDFNETIVKIAKIAKENGLWKIEGTFGNYSYTYDFKDLDIKNAKGKPADEYIKVSREDGKDIYVKFDITKSVIDTLSEDLKKEPYKYEISYVLYTQNETDSKKYDPLVNDPENVDDLYDKLIAGYESVEKYLAAEIGFDAKAHVYDVRKAAAEIGANFAKFNNVNKVASTKTYSVVTEAQLQTIFNAEATAIYNKDIAAEKAKIYKMSGSDVVNGDIADGKLAEAALSGEALDQANIYLQKMTADYKALIDATTTIEDAKAVVEEFKAIITAYFNGLKKSEE